MATTSTNVFGAEILRALGIDPKHVTSATIRLRAGYIPTVTVRCIVMPDTDKTKAVCESAEQFELLPRRKPPA